jgi:hypothetical protein
VTVTDTVTGELLIRLPSGEIHDIGAITLDPANLRDDLADALETAAADIRSDGLADGR